MAAVEVGVHEEFEGPVGRPHLRLVTFESSPWTVQQGRPVGERRAARALKLKRRRRALVILAILAGLSILALPGVAFGGIASSGLSSDLAQNATLAAGMVYVVQPGDTLNSIARMMDPADAPRARDSLVRELDSSVVVSGEHVLIP
jgi:hypothetical protein